MEYIWNLQRLSTNGEDGIWGACNQYPSYTRLKLKKKTGRRQTTNHVACAFIQHFCHKIWRKYTKHLGSRSFDITYTRSVTHTKDNVHKLRRPDHVIRIHYHASYTSVTENERWNWNHTRNEITRLGIKLRNTDTVTVLEMKSFKIWSAMDIYDLQPNATSLLQCVSMYQTWTSICKASLSVKYK